VTYQISHCEKFDNLLWLNDVCDSLHPAVAISPTAADRIQFALSVSTDTRRCGLAGF
jgi:hypothetical protein